MNLMSNYGSGEQCCETRSGSGQQLGQLALNAAFPPTTRLPRCHGRCTVVLSDRCAKIKAQSSPSSFSSSSSQHVSRPLRQQVTRQTATRRGSAGRRLPLSHRERRVRLPAQAWRQPPAGFGRPDFGAEPRSVQRERAVCHQPEGGDADSDDLLKSPRNCGCVFFYC